MNDSLANSIKRFVASHTAAGSTETRRELEAFNAECGGVIPAWYLAQFHVARFAGGGHGHASRCRSEPNSREMIPFDFDHAMCTYLGGAPDSGAIQTGMRDDRLLATYGDRTLDVKKVLDDVLTAALERMGDGYADDGHTIGSWLALELPSASLVTRKKIESHVLYHIQH